MSRIRAAVSRRSGRWPNATTSRLFSDNAYWAARRLASPVVRSAGFVTTAETTRLSIEGGRRGFTVTSSPGRRISGRLAGRRSNSSQVSKPAEAIAHDRFVGGRHLDGAAGGHRG